MKRVLVTGDFIYDTNLLHFHLSSEAHSTRLPSAVLLQQPGGARYVADLVREACADLRHVEVLWHRSTANQAYSIWAPFRRHEGTDEEVWRVAQFLGCEPAPGAPSDPPSDPGAATLADPDLLVIDDLERGFSDDETQWPAALRPGGAPKRVLLKTTRPVTSSKLWTRLFVDLADRLTVVVPADLLRALDAPLSTALSWDRTIAETVREFKERFSRESIGRCRRVVVAFGFEGAASFTRDPLKLAPTWKASDRVRFERFVYHPEHLEGSWTQKRPGIVFGGTSIVAAALARHEIEGDGYPLNIALSRALEAMRQNHEHGGGPAVREKLVPPDLGKTLRLPTPAGTASPPGPVLQTAFPHAALDHDSPLGKQADDVSSLLRDYIGSQHEFVAAAAVDVVRRGSARALSGVPRLRFGKYVTVDAMEIERLGAMRSRILAYRGNPAKRTPLSFAVFGPPGSGKSFAIKQLAADLFGREAAVLEFNLSQFEGTRDLRSALHRVRDCSLQGNLPLVFWDEFDANRDDRDLGWLKDFLAPMQDGHFVVENVVHALGKAIFVFAGGTRPSFDEFSRMAAGSSPSDDDKQLFRSAKGPDFVRRLAGFIDIKGPNPTAAERDPAAFPAYLIRRAFLLRSILERDYPHLIDKNGDAQVSTGAINAFIRVERYNHGAGSLETVLHNSSLAAKRPFSVGALPPPELLHIHVTKDFLDYARSERMEDDVVEALAEAAHQAWCELRTKQGWAHGAVRDDAAKKHDWLIPYAQLAPAVKEGNRRTARLLRAKLHEIGLTIEPCDRASGKTTFLEVERERLTRLEHDIWLRERLLEGYEYAKETRRDLRLHDNIAPLHAMTEAARELDAANVDIIPDTLWARGYTLVRRAAEGA